jgi:hypothetical protein
MHPYKKGDWVVIEGLEGSIGQLESDPYEITVYYEARPITSKRIMVVDFHNPDSPQTPVDRIRPATNKDFLDWIASIKASIAHTEKYLEIAKQRFNEFLVKKHNLDILD